MKYNGRTHGGYVQRRYGLTRVGAHQRQSGHVRRHSRGRFCYIVRATRVRRVRTACQRLVCGYRMVGWTPPSCEAPLTSEEPESAIAPPESTGRPVLIQTVPASPDPAPRIVETTYVSCPTTVIREEALTPFVDLSGLVAEGRFERQTDRIFDTIADLTRNTARNLTDALASIADSLTTAMLTVTGNATIGGDLTVSNNVSIGGTLTRASSPFRDWRPKTRSPRRTISLPRRATPRTPTTFSTSILQTGGWGSGPLRQGLPFTCLFLRPTRFRHPP